MKKVIFKGSGVAIITPMNSDGSINYNKLEELIEFQIQNNTDSIIICGTTGESAALTEEEHNNLIKFTVEKVNKRIPVIAGTGSNNTQKALEHSLNAQEVGVDGLLIVTPYYNKTSQSGLIKHYNYIADNVDTPIILYNVPSRTGLNIKPETYKELSKHPNIVATKEASGDLSSIAKIVSICGNDLLIYSGNDDQTVPIMSVGGIGVISVFANICPKISHDLTERFLNGDVRGSSNLQIKYLKLMNALFSDVNPIPIKEALNLLGYNCGNCRMPLYKMSDENIENLKLILKEYKLL